MSSPKAEPLDLERDLPTSVEDAAALRRLRRLPAPGWADYLRFVRQLGDADPAVLRTRPGPRGDEPFTLPPPSPRQRST